MSRVTASGSVLLLGLLLAPVGAQAQCVVAGRGIVRDVTPNGTSLRFGLAEEARVALDGARATVHGVTPIAFEGRARSSDVELSLASPRRLLGVVQADAGVALRVTRGRTNRVSARIDAGPTRLWVELPCDALRFGAPAAEEPAALPVEPVVDDTALVRVRGDELRAFRSALGADAVVLRRRPGDERGWPYLEVLGANSGRVHVRAELEVGIVLDAWVARENVGPMPTAFSACGCDVGGMGGCGHGFAGETYRGPATLTSGAALMDARGTVWGRLVSEVEAEVAVTAIGVSVSSEGETTRYVSETVWVERLPGVIGDPCAAIQIRIDRAAVTLPSPS